MLNKKRLSDNSELKKTEQPNKIPLLIVNNTQIHNQQIHNQIKKEVNYLTPSKDHKKINNEEFLKTANSSIPNKNSIFFHYT